MWQKGGQFEGCHHDFPKAGMRRYRSGKAYDYLSANIFGVQPSGGSDIDDETYDCCRFEQDECTEHV
jgi:hypothetical protein